MTATEQLRSRIEQKTGAERAAVDEAKAELAAGAAAIPLEEIERQLQSR